MCVTTIHGHYRILRLSRDVSVTRPVRCLPDILGCFVAIYGRAVLSWVYFGRLSCWYIWLQTASSMDVSAGCLLHIRHMTFTAEPASGWLWTSVFILRFFFCLQGFVFSID